MFRREFIKQLLVAAPGFYLSSLATQISLGESLLQFHQSLTKKYNKTEVMSIWSHLQYVEDQYGLFVICFKEFADSGDCITFATWNGIDKPVTNLPEKFLIPNKTNVKQLWLDYHQIRDKELRV